jgi:hypothetical protein
MYMYFFCFVKSSSHKLIYSQINIMYIDLIVIVHETLIYASFISNVLLSQFVLYGVLSSATL